MNKLPIFDGLPIHQLSQVFGNTTNSYKLYWFWSILDLIKFNNKQELEFSEVILKMISLSWHTVTFFKVSLGKQDQIKNAIEKLSLAIPEINNDLSPQERYKLLLSNIDHPTVKSIVKDFSRYVPYRFLSVFFNQQLKGKSNKERAIQELSVSEFDSDSPPVYKIEGKRIIIHQDWFSYFKKHMPIIEGFCLWNLVDYLQSRNPSVPNIGKKLIYKPESRDLKNAKLYWKIVATAQPINCIYSNEILTDYSIDHFLPWSFVSHDLLWNLVPTTKGINSSKSNSLADMDLYLNPFLDLQYQSFHIVYDKEKHKLLEDYSNLFREDLKTLSTLGNDVFKKRLHSHITPLYQIALNSGFDSGWRV